MPPPGACRQRRRQQRESVIARMVPYAFPVDEPCPRPFGKLDYQRGLNGHRLRRASEEKDGQNHHLVSPPYVTGRSLRERPTEKQSAGFIEPKGQTFRQWQQAVMSTKRKVNEQRLSDADKVVS